MPSVFGKNLFDDFFGDFAFPEIDRTIYGRHANNLMRTDVKETDSGYEVDIDMPGFKKEDIRMELEKGYLTVSAAKEYGDDQKDDKGRYVKRERYSGSVSRSFYVGENVTEEDIHPRYENGILSFCLPKEEQKTIEEKKHYIAIEG